MAIPSTAIWEVETGGSDTLNGSSFDPGNANMTTDGAATSANTSAPVFTSASYNFVSGDVGAWLFIKSGTNWIPGWYKIASVASNAATLSAAIGAAVLPPSTNSLATNQPTSLNTSAGCASVASPTAATWTVDYSQQSSAIALTSLTTAAANAIILTASATVAMVGNGLIVKAGTNFTTGYYSISSVSAGVSITVDRNCTSAAGAAGTAGVGGAMATLSQVSTVFVAGNSAWIQYGTYTITSTITFGVATVLPVISYISGYHLVRTDTDGVRPIITTSTNSVDLITISATATHIWIMNIKFINSAVTQGIGVSITTCPNCYVVNCLFDGCSNAISSAGAGNAINVLFCSIINCSGFGLLITSTAAIFMEYCFVYNCTSGGLRNSSSSGAQNVEVYRSIISGNGGDGVSMLTNGDGYNYTFIQCTISNNTGNGINFNYNNNNANNNDNSFINNIFYGNSGWGILVTGSGTIPMIGSYNFYGNNSSGQSTGMHVDLNPITIPRGNPFNNSAAGDFSLNNLSGLSIKKAGFPGTFPGGLTVGYLDGGALQSGDISLSTLPIGFTAGARSVGTY